MVTFSGVENMGSALGWAVFLKFNPNQISAPLPNESNLGESFRVSFNCSRSEIRIKRAKQLVKPRLGRAAAAPHPELRAFSPRPILTLLLRSTL